MQDEYNYEFENFRDFPKFSLFSSVGIFVVLASEIYKKSKSFVKEFVGWSGLS